MTKLVVDRCISLFKEYQRRECVQEQQETRNRLFLIMKPYIETWLMSIARRRGVFINEQELISLSWESFLFCLDRYRQGNPILIQNHFFAYTRFFFLRWQVREAKRKSILEDLEDNMATVSFEDEILLLDEIVKLKKLIPKEYQIVFDDTLKSMAGENKDKVKTSKKIHGLSMSQYHTAKKIFKVMIEHFLINNY